MSKYLIIALLVSFGLFGVYFKITQSKIELLNNQNAVLEVANQQNQTTITVLKETAQKNEERSRELQINLDKAEITLDDLRKILQEHNLTRLATIKPGLIESRMQRATDELFENYFSNSNTSGN